MRLSFTKSYIPLPDDTNSGLEVNVTGLVLYDNRSFPKHQYQFDSAGVFISKDGRQQLLSIADLDQRFPDAYYSVPEAIEKKDIEGMGYYKVPDSKAYVYFAVVKTGLEGGDVSSYEYVFHIPNQSTQHENH